MASPVSSSAGPRGPAADDANLALLAAAAEALTLVPAGARVGLGTGRAAAAFIRALGAKVAQGFSVLAVATSAASERQARALHIPLGRLDEIGPLDLTVDGADEVAPNLDLIKGRGGALVRERIVAAASARQVILISPDKRVSALGMRGPLPVEIIPMARALVVRALDDLGLDATVRLGGADDAAAGAAAPFISENGNLILDCRLHRPLLDGAAARDLHQAVRAIAGVVDTGLFLGTADRVIVGEADGSSLVLLREPPSQSGGLP